MAKKQKYYVVWRGKKPGIYTSWEDCKAQTHGQKDARFKSFASLDIAREAFNTEAPKNSPSYTDKNKKVHTEPAPRHDTVLSLPAEVTADAIAVDAACSGNPGPMEYRGVDLRTGQEIFHLGPIFGTNNIGEFLAIVHAVAKLTQENKNMTVYSDSRNGMLWFRQGQCKTKIAHNSRSTQVLDLIERAEKWLNTHTHQISVKKWDTNKWGEIPADFGRK